MLSLTVYTFSKCIFSLLLLDVLIPNVPFDCSDAMLFLQPYSGGMTHSVEAAALPSKNLHLC